MLSLLSTSSDSVGLGIVYDVVQINMTLRYLHCNKQTVHV